MASESKEIYKTNPPNTLDGSLTTTYDYESTYGNLNWQTVTGSIPNSLTTSYQYLAPIINTNQYIVSLPSRVWTERGATTLAETLNTYNASGVLTTTRTLMDSSPSNQYSQVDFGYDQWGNVTSQTAYSGYSNGSSTPSGARTTTTVYDSIYRTYPISITNPLGQVTTIDYSGVAVAGTSYTGYTLSVPTSATGPNGTATRIDAQYDVFARLVKLARPGNGDSLSSPTLQIAYSNSPFTVTLTQKIQTGQSYVLSRAYDGLGRPTLVTAGGISTAYQYGYVSGAGSPRLDKVSMPGATTTFTTTQYDALGRPLVVTAPDGTVTNYNYNGLETKVWDARSNLTTTTTDILGRTTSVDAPTGPDIAFVYDDLGNLTSASRGGATVTMNYDLAGRKESMSDPDMGNWTYQYDALSNLTVQTDARGCILSMNYDNLNRPLTKSSSGNCGQHVSVTYGYDAYAAGSNYGKGLRTSMTDASGSTAWTYDERGRVKSETKIIGANSFLTQWTYNSADLPVTMTYPDNETVTTTYNTRMLPTSVAGTNTYAQSMTYDSAGRLTDLLLGNGLGQKFRYKAWTAQGGRLDTLVSGTGTWNEASLTFTTTLQKSTYSYDNVGNITNISDSVWGETQVFGYDNLNRLTSASATGGLANYSETYQYDPSTGNLVNKNGLVLSYPPANGARPHAVTGAGSNTYGYDSNGNQTTRNIAGNNYTLGYDAENRLVSVTGPSLSAQFTFDGDGRRVKSVVNGETILFAGGHYELKGNEVSKYYFAGATRIAVRKYVVPQTTTLNYLVGDHLGSTSLVTNASGALVAETRYKPWGEVRYVTASQTLPTRYTFTGQYSYVNDDATDLGAAGFGLMFYNARWYDPALGRMAQADTVVPGGVQGLDRYAYVNNSPVKYTDPSGHEIPGRCNWMKNYNCETPGWALLRAAAAQAASGGAAKVYAAPVASPPPPPSQKPQPSAPTVNQIESTYGVTLVGNWAPAQLGRLSAALDAMAAFVGGVDKLNNIFDEASGGKGFVFDLRPGNNSPQECHGGYACADGGTIIVSEYIFTSAYQQSHQWGYGAEFSFLHEMGHVIAHTNPQYQILFYWAVKNPYEIYGKATKDFCNNDDWCAVQEDMATAIAYYAITGGLPTRFPDQTDAIRSTYWYWQ